MTQRHYQPLDFLILAFERILKINQPEVSIRENPSHSLDEPALNPQEMKESASLMRINHTGEVCAQALYLGQSFTQSNSEIRQVFFNASIEESDHLQWCHSRLTELNASPSLFNAGWFASSFMLGSIASLWGEKWSLGFLMETEHQVYQHLESHLAKLPISDTKSRAILKQMQIEELEHMNTAKYLHANELPYPIKCSMKIMSTLMTTLSYYA